MSEPSAIDVLINRVSCGLLTGPAPSGEALTLIQRAALRAADHRQLRPWRFLQVEGEGLVRLGELFLAAKLGDNPELSPEDAARTRGLPLRAPLVIVAIARCVHDPKVPEVEQLLSAGATVQNMLNAAHALGVGAMWRTGDLASHPRVRDGLGLAANETIIGFLYLGTPQGTLREAPRLDPETFFKTWP
ncbi:MAG: nitroreductase family protein [Porticoccaceae bacterium]|nr:nitroreductase family protein [Porticoccaceae bacterium]MEA3300152.1 nitroreductase family protein [Pseudomonadota bacterium]HLS97908.1 nitroreductase family protein [Porticoccaceae bacterium]